jgi:hypothetical protein
LLWFGRFRVHRYFDRWHRESGAIASNWERMRTGLLCLRMKGLLAVVLAGKEERSNQRCPPCRAADPKFQITFHIPWSFIDKFYTSVLISLFVFLSLYCLVLTPDSHYCCTDEIIWCSVLVWAQQHLR